MARKKLVKAYFNSLLTGRKRSGMARKKLVKAYFNSLLAGNLCGAI
jgi:hypothetical protein